MERRLLKPLIEWSPADVDALISEQVPEGQRLEYKSQLNLGQPKENHEAAKDVSGLANASGGLLIYGVAEKELPDGRVIPTRLSPFSDGSARERLEDVLDSTVSPVLNVDLRLLDITGGYVLLVRTFQRAGPLHMVEGFKDGAHYLRVGHKTRRMAQHEIERAYVNLSRQIDRQQELLNSSPPLARLTRTRSQHQLLLATKGIIATGTTTNPMPPRSQPAISPTWRASRCLTGRPMARSSHAAFTDEEIRAAHDRERRRAQGTPIELRHVGYTTLCTLQRANIVTYEDLADVTETRLREVRGIGVKRAGEIIEAMAAHGFALRPQRPLKRLIKAREIAGLKPADVARKIGVWPNRVRR
jgi:hypothetical protein